MATIATIHERQFADLEEKLTPQPKYCLNTRCPHNSNVKWTWSLERWKSINSHKKVNLSSESFTVSKSRLLEEARRTCPHLDVPAILKRYCQLTECLSQNGHLPEHSYYLEPPRQHSSQTRPSSSEADGLLQLVCRIPIWRDGDRLKVSLPPVKTLPWTHVYAPMKTKHMMANSHKCEVLKEWLLCWPGTNPGTATSTTNNTTVKKRRTFMKKLAQDTEWRRNGCQLDLDLYSSDEEQETEDNHKFPTVTLLYGRHGTGKTAAVYACAAEAGLEVFEINASSLRNRTQLVKKLREVFRSYQVRPSPFFGLKKSSHSQLTVSQSSVILVDEIDVVLEDDVGFLQALQEVVADSSRPVVLTCNDRPLKLSMQTLDFHFIPPSQIELGVHLSVLSLAHQEVALSLPMTCYWSRQFNCDIRKSLLHLQCSLTTPTQLPLPPSGLLTRIYQATPLCTPPLESTTPIRPLVPIATPTYTPIQSTWKMKLGCSDMGVVNGDKGVVTELEQMSYKSDYKSYVDCLVPAITASGNDLWIPWQPYTARLAPGTLDRHSHGAQEDGHCLTLSHNIIQEMEYRRGLLDRKVESNGIHGSTTAQSLHCEAAATLFSTQCALYRKEVMSESLPYLKCMYLQESANRKTTTKRRCPRHYFHSQQQELQKYFSI